MNWYVIHTKSKCELKAQRYFEANAIETFLPLKTLVSKRNGKVIKTTAPVISGYLFFKMNIIDYPLINSNPNTRSLVRNFGEVATVSDEEMQAMNSCFSEGSSLGKTISEGATVAIENGFFAGRFGEVVETRGNAVVLYISSLQLKITVSLQTNTITVA